MSEVHVTEYFPISDYAQPGLAYVQALKCAEKNGDFLAGTLDGTVQRAHNDAGEIIGYIVRHRHTLDN